MKMKMLCAVSVCILILVLLILVFDGAAGSRQPRKAEIIRVDEDSAFVQVYYEGPLTGLKTLVNLDDEDSRHLWQEAINKLRSEWGPIHRSVATNNARYQPVKWLVQKK